MKQQQLKEREEQIKQRETEEAAQRAAAVQEGEAEGDDCAWADGCEDDDETAGDGKEL
jgi:hypothetical protein